MCQPSRLLWLLPPSLSGCFLPVLVLHPGHYYYYYCSCTAVHRCGENVYSCARGYSYLRQIEVITEWHSSTCSWSYHEYEYTYSAAVPTAVERLLCMFSAAAVVMLMHHPRHSKRQALSACPPGTIYACGCIQILIKEVTGPDVRERDSDDLSC